MAAITAPPKQTMHTQPAFAAIGEAIRFLPHHTKPFRKRHILFLLLILVFIGSIFLELAVVITRQSLDPRTLFSQAVTPVAQQTNSVVRSSNGFGFIFNNQQFSATVRSTTINGIASDAELGKNAALSSVLLKPLPSYVPPAEAAAELEVTVETDQAAFATYKASVKKKSDIAEITANYFAPKPTSSAVIREEMRTTESIGGSLMTKAIYVIEPKFAGNPTHTIVWSTEVEGKAASLVIRGIVDGTQIPSTMKPVLDSMQFATKNKVQGLAIFSNEPAPITLDQKYTADLVSPAVVKVYHVVCGSLIYNGAALASDTCNGTSGSGFIVSANGYIATNGHVVVYGAKDMLVNALLSNKTLLAQFLSGAKFNPAQVQEVLSRPDLTASVVSRLYDVPDANLKLANARELTVVATGKAPFKVSDEAEVRKVINSFESTENLLKATVVGYDYAAKDQLTLVADPDKGFSASDVALLKIDVQDAPLIKLSTTPVTQNQTMTLFGFPGDADNQLTNNSKLDVTVTNGNISAIRQAAGSESTLYQSDADASQGNSGGPAVDSDGTAFGLLTYRYTSGEKADAAKSYIRSIDDFSDLVKDKRVTLTTESRTQAAWQRGLDLYSKHAYSKALTEFETVQRLYPSHRLATTYIDFSKQAIRDGKDITDPPSVLLILGLGAGLGGLGIAIVLIARHHGRHQIYRTFHHHKPSLQA